MTLLQLFIEDRNSIYREPERRGIQKGHEIGIYRGRHDAALNSMFDYEQKEIARRSNISYAFLRKLRTEKSFKGCLELFLDEYTEHYLYNYLSSGRVLKNEMASGIYESDLKPFPYSVDTAFQDASSYSQELKTMIADDFIYMIEKDGIEKWLGSHERLVSLITKWDAPELNKKIFSTVVRLSDAVIRRTLGTIDIPESDRINAIACCRFMGSLAATI